MADRNGPTRARARSASDTATEATAAAGAAGAPAPRRGHTRRRVLLWGAGSLAGAGVLGVGGVFLTDRLRRFARHADRRVGAAGDDHAGDCAGEVDAMVADPAIGVAREAPEAIGEE